MSGALPKGRFWREVKYTEQRWAVQGKGSEFVHQPRPFTPAQIRRILKKELRASKRNSRARDFEYTLKGF
jgi:hypothetical protein